MSFWIFVKNAENYLLNIDKIMKKILITLFAFLFIVGGASASQLWEYGSFNERADKAVEIGLVGNSDEYVGNYKQNLILLDYYEPTLGVAIPKVIAWFEDTLQASISSLATSLTLVDGTDKEGNSLSGTYGLTIDEGGANEELVIATCAGTACTSITRGVSVADGETSVTALKKSHRRGASIKITNAPTLIVVQRVMNGDEGFPNRLWYDDQPTFASTTDIVTKKYVDDVGAGGFTASNVDTDYGIQVFGTSPETLGIDLASLSGLRMDNDGDLQIATSTGSGVYVDTDNTIKVATSSDFAWTGTHSFSGTNTFSATSTFSANLIADGFVQAYTALEGISAMDAVISTSTATTTSQMVAQADASLASTTYSFIGFALTDADGGETVYVQTSGEVSGFTGGLTTTTLYFLSDTAGEISDSSGTVEGIVGIATDYDTINLDTRSNYGMQYVGSMSITTSATTVVPYTAARFAIIKVTAGGTNCAAQGTVTIARKGIATATLYETGYGVGTVCSATYTWVAGGITNTVSASESPTQTATAYFYR